MKNENVNDNATNTEGKEKTKITKETVIRCLKKAGKGFVLITIGGVIGYFARPTIDGFLGIDDPIVTEATVTIEETDESVDEDGNDHEEHWVTPDNSGATVINF